MNRMFAEPQNTNLLSAHQQVALALNPRLIQPVLRPLTEKHSTQSVSAHSPKGACHILDAKYEPGKRCSILYAVRQQMIIGELTWPSKEAQSANVAALLPTMQLYPFDRDPGMPTLRTVMDGATMQRILHNALPECAAGDQRILRCRATLLRYRLGRRCTLRYDLRLRNVHTGAMTKRTLYGKLYHSADKAAAVYQEMHLLAAAPAHDNAENLSGTNVQSEEKIPRNGLVVAKAVAYIPSLPMILQAPIREGTPLELLLQQPPNAHPTQLAQVTAGIRRAAAALAELHQSSVRSDRIRAVDAELKKLERRSSRIANVDAATGADLHRLAWSLRTWRKELSDWREEITLVHGDCKPSQFFLLPDGETALLDFDHCGMADPAADVGNFLATLRQMGVKQILKQRSATPTATNVAAWQQWLATLETAFLDEYVASRACATGFRQRATWYQAMALLRKALRSYARSTRSPLPSLLVQEAWRLLAAC